MRKKYILLFTLIGLLVFLSACGQINEPITAESEGIWNNIFVYPLSWLITQIATIFNNSYGLGIIIITIVIRLILLPLNIKQIKSSKAMQEVQPEMQELQKKYSSKDANTQQKLQEETMKLMQKYEVNPLAGCLPILIQIPIMFALYHAIMRTEAISNYSFLWFQLGEPDPYYILPILTALFTFLQQRIMMSYTSTSGGGNPQMEMQMKMMQYVMPLMIGVAALFFPSALALYWVTGNIFMLLQTLLINKPMMQKDNDGGAKK